MAEFSSLNGYTVKDTTARNIAKGRNQAVAYSNYGAMVDALNAMDNAEFRTGQNIYIGTVGVPDLWVYTVEPVRNTFSYVSDEKIVELLQNKTTIQVGYYKLAMLEGQKVDLTNVNAAIAENASAIAENASAISELNKNISVFGKIKKTTITGTTSEAGILRSTLPVTANVLSAKAKGYYAMPLIASAGDVILFVVGTVNTVQLLPKTNSQVSIEVIYCE